MTEGDRLDNVTARYLGDPEQFWRLGDANTEMRADELTTEVGRRLKATLVPMGSAGAKTMSVLLGETDVYLHAGGQHEWDSAAPVAVALAAGLHASRVDGSPLAYNRFPAWQPDLVVCRPELSDIVLQSIRDASPHP